MVTARVGMGPDGQCYHREEQRRSIAGDGGSLNIGWMEGSQRSLLRMITGMEKSIVAMHGTRVEEVAIQ